MTCDGFVVFRGHGEMNTGLLMGILSIGGGLYEVFFNRGPRMAGIVMEFQEALGQLGIVQTWGMEKIL